jgi:hypothetical protein
MHGATCPAEPGRGCARHVLVIVLATEETVEKKHSTTAVCLILALPHPTVVGQRLPTLGSLLNELEVLEPVLEVVLAAGVARQHWQARGVTITWLILPLVFGGQPQARRGAAGRERDHGARNASHEGMDDGAKQRPVILPSGGTEKQPTENLLFRHLPADRRRDRLKQFGHRPWSRLERVGNLKHHFIRGKLSVKVGLPGFCRNT